MLAVGSLSVAEPVGGDPATPPRRSQAENRERLLGAGRELFASQGYPATTHKQIVSLAGVSTAVLWRNFGSKSQLLLEVVIEPFGAFVEDVVTAVASMDARAGDGLAAPFVADLYRRLLPHQRNLRALLTALQSADGEGLMREFGIRLDTLFAQLRPHLGADDAASDEVRQAEVALRVAVGMVTTAVVLHDWFFTPEQYADPERVIGVLSSMCAFGTRVDSWSTGPPVSHSPESDEQRDGGLSEPPAQIPELPDGRQRRGSSDVRQALLASATRLFSVSGFSATSYRDIASAAGTSESALYRHFGSKSNLLVEGVLKPFTDAFESATRRWARMPAGDRRSRQAELIVELFGNLRAHRQLLRVLMGLASDPDHGDLHAAVTSWFAAAFEELHLLTGQRARHESDLTAEPDLRLRAFMAMVLSMAALDDWFLPPDDAIRSAEVVAVMSDLVTLSRRGHTASSGAF
jgi:AcrR family transcriptional regulator